MKSNLEVIESILGKCSLIGISIITLWFVLYETGIICKLSQSLFSINEHECSLLSYGGIGLYKIIVYSLFVIPWIAIKLELRKQK